MGDILFSVWILHQPSAIFFICGQPRKIDQGDRRISSTSELSWKEIADQFASTMFYGFGPVFWRILQNQKGGSGLPCSEIEYSSHTAALAPEASNARSD
jgi:hypothetical protein